MKVTEFNKWTNLGVVIKDSITTFIDDEVVIGEGSIIYPNVSIRGKSVIGKNNIIDSFTIIEDTIIGDNNKIISSNIGDSVISNNNQIGPYSHFREKVVLGDNNKVGNYVEIKDSTIGSNNFFSHLSYVGNSDIGSKINFSGGAITANFNWKKQEYNRTVIKDEAFVGCNSVLVAPVVLNRKAYVAAGSVITLDVPESALAIARPRQENKGDYFL